VDVELIWKYCSQKTSAIETFPFDKTTLVFKIENKMFALFNIDNFSGLNLKCDPERSIELRERYSGIIPAFHMNKKHWNTVKVNEDVDFKLVQELIDHSYDLVVSSLPKKIRDGIKVG
jgi:predicted DNA-binding protein (MmcQ/YjbR family)